MRTLLVLPAIVLATPVIGMAVITASLLRIPDRPAQTGTFEAAPVPA